MDNLNTQATPQRRLHIASPLPKCSDLTWRMHARQEVNYSVSLNTGLLKHTNATLAYGCGANGVQTVRRLVVIDARVNELYGEEFRAYFEAWKIQVVWKVMSGDEAFKTMDHAIEVAQAMAAANLLRRNEVVIGIGGGVLLDVVGFASSLYRRGIPYIRIPTTLMGQIDAGIGIKTGVNHDDYKNRLGTYYAPSSAFIDPYFLQTMDQRHISNGVAEIIKMALIKDRDLFELLEDMSSNLTPKAFASNDPRIKEIMSRAIAGMLAELEPNLWEAELARCVDYGHTFSPSLELLAEPALLHGEAVAVDMALCVALAAGRGLLSAADAERAIDLIEIAGLPVSHPVFNLQLLEKALADTIKHRDGLQRIPLSDGIGQTAFVNDVSRADLEQALLWIEQRGERRADQSCVA
ncbi:sedoheptulose 7-phosphate cyclase [Pseudomonas sp. TWP3-2]|uniref:sedoheptulose 7-phosphate cyclase n=1 Tax=Pseudomonas sp. TWP3-2 TaxID=2804574 RepID=UPI003CEF8AB5